MNRILVSALTSVLAVLFSATASTAASRLAPDIILDDIGGKTRLLNVRSITQDEDGTIWFGTDKCLYSYDGYDVKAHPDGIGHIQINSLAAIGKTVHLGTGDGLYSFDMEDESYSRNSFLRDEHILSLAALGDTLYIGTRSGMYSFRWTDDVTGGYISNICPETIVPMVLSKEKIWAGTLTGLIEYSPKTNRYRRIDISLPSGQGPVHVVSSILEDTDSTLWIGTPTNLIKWGMNDRAISMTASVPVLKAMCRIQNDFLLLGTDNGLVLFDCESGQKKKIKNLIVNSFFKDRDGNLWLATESGLMIFRQDVVLKEMDTSACPEEARYSTILKDSSGRLWAGGSNGIVLFKPDGLGGYIFESRFAMEGSEHHIPHNRISKLTEDKSCGKIYAATDRGILEYDDQSGDFNRIITSISSRWMYDIIPDGDCMWIASFDGLIYLKHRELEHLFTVEDGLTDNDVAQIAEDSDKNIWILTRNQNVFLLDSESHCISKFDLEQYCGTSYAECLSDDKDGDIWICAKSHLIQIDGHDEENVTVRDIAPMPNMESYSIQDIGPEMWICSSEGVFVIDKHNQEPDIISIGAPYLSICHDEAYSNIILGTAGHISYFNIEDKNMVIGQRSYPVQITSVTVDNKDELPLQEIRTGKVSLSSRENNLTISFTDHNYNSVIPSRFLITLKARNSVWSENVSDNSIILPSLKPGKYSLFISTAKSSTAGDVPALAFRIKPPWHFAWPMILLYLLATGIVIFGRIKFTIVKKHLQLEREQRDVLLAQTKEKEAFFGNIAHEFKTPLSMIIAPLSKYINDNESARTNGLLTVALENANKLNALARNTIDYYRDNSHESIDMIVSEVEFVEFARTIFYSFKDGFPNDEFIFDSSEPEIFADIDVVRMEAVLNNLISNACKYTPDGGSIIMTIERDKENDHIILKLSDTGIGIPDNELNLVFQRYFESSRSKKGNYDSTGIGLSIIKKNVESHNGSVSVSSDENGTTFTVILPCKKARNKRDDTGQAGNDMSDKPLIVIVEDNAQVCSFLEQMFNDKYRTISSGNGKSGLKLCKDVMPDLIISDVMMPVMDGLEMCRQIREYAPLATIPIILLTARSDAETERKSISLSIDSFMPKPFDFAMLAARVDQLLGNKKRMEQKIRMEIVSKIQDTQELSSDEKYLKKVTDIIEEHIDDSDLSVASLCKFGNFNDKQLYRKIKQLTGLSTVEYVRSIRLKKAAILLQNGNFTISEVMYSVGFSNASYFTRAFASEYGKTPSEYMKSYKK